jgi:hypothetical protein
MEPSCPATIVVTPWLTVDEPRRERLPRRVHHALAAPRLELADLDDAIAVDAHGARARRAAGAIHDRGVDDQRRAGGFPGAAGEAGEQRGGERRTAGDRCLLHSNGSLIFVNGRPRSPGDQ